MAVIADATVFWQEQLIGLHLQAVGDGHQCVQRAELAASLYVAQILLRDAHLLCHGGLGYMTTGAKPLYISCANSDGFFYGSHILILINPA